MDSSFADWYRLASIEPSDEMLRKRWAGVEAATKSLGASDEIVRLFLGRSSVSAEAVQTFRNCFFEADSLFKMTGNDNELRVLAGALLIHVLKTENQQTARTSLAILCSYCHGLIKDNALPDVVTRAKQVVFAFSVLYRSSTKYNPSLNEKSFEQILQSLPKAAEGNENKNVTQVTTEVVNRLVETVRSINGLIVSHNSLAEETNILWWLFAEFSTILEMHCSGFAANAAILPLAKELADLTTSPIGPVSADAILGRMLSITKESSAPVTLTSIVEATPPERRKLLLRGAKGLTVRDFCPIHFTLDQIDTAGSVAGALANTSNVLSVRLNESLSPGDWASQYYRECLFLRLGPN